MSARQNYAMELHEKGYNCAQAVACSFCKDFGVEEEGDVPYCRRIWVRNGNDGDARRPFRYDDDHGTCRKCGKIRKKAPSQKGEPIRR